MHPFFDTPEKKSYSQYEGASVAEWLKRFVADLAALDSIPVVAV